MGNYRKTKNNTSTAMSRVFAFIDSQNLHMSTKADGWKIDHRKLRLYLTNKYGVEQAYLFIGYLDGQEAMYRSLQEAGYILVFKPTMPIKKGKKVVVKGNVDAELVLHASAIVYDQYDKAVIISNDGDFACLVEYLVEKGKLLKVIVPNDKYSGLLRKYDKHIARLSQSRGSVEYKKTRTSGRSKP